MRGTGRDRLRRTAGVVGRLSAFVAVAAVMGLLAGSLALPFLGLAGAGARVAARTAAELPTRLDFEPLPQRSVMLDRNGRRLATFFDQNRVTVPLAEVDPLMRGAILAIEDHRFYEHGALDLKGTLRALVSNSAGDEVQGGSSITQQLVKMTLLEQAKTPEEQAAATERTYRRKVDELRYAIQVESDRSKDWILQRYLNTAYYGDGAHGIEAAARHFFSRSASDLTLRQAALLAGLVKNPAGFDPTRFPEAARERRDVVLDRMAQLGIVTREDADRAKQRPLGLDLSPTPNGCVSASAAFFCDYARRLFLADERFGPDEAARRDLLRRGGLTLLTTLDPRFQRAAQRSVDARVDPRDRAIGALAMVQPRSGAVRAIAQSRPMGRNAERGQTFLNYVVPEEYGDAGGFQAGSTFKAFVLAAALDQGISPRARIQAPPRISVPVSRFRGCDGPLTSTDVWEPGNSTSSGTFDLYQGTQQSVNTFFAKLELQTGLCRPYRLAQELGIRLDDPDNQQVPAFTLGVVPTSPLAMAGAYATFAGRGVHCTPRALSVVRNADGEPIARYGRDCDRVLPPDVADTVNDILRGVQEPGGFGHGAGIALDQPSAGKTGTIQSNRAVWFVGYTPTMATAAMLAGANRQGHWVTLNGQVVGGSLIDSASGSRHAGPIWGGAMQAAQRWLPDRDFVPPPREVVRDSRVRVPDVTGLEVGAARLLLRQAGLFVRVADGLAADDTVRSTLPAAGERVGRGHEVLLSNKRPERPERPERDDRTDEGDRDREPERSSQQRD
jgi:membrane peptidoglycan carboxypeptidase